MIVKISDLLDIYNNEILKGVKNRKKILAFEKCKIEYLVYIKYILENGLYQGSSYNIFLVREPKIRVVMSESIINKIINHYVAKYILIPKLSKYLCKEITATRKGMGLSYAIKLLLSDIEKLKHFNKDIYVLKIDIKKYFYSIDYNILKSLIINDLTNEEYNLVCKIIDSTNYDYINQKINILEKEVNEKLPRYKNGVGLSLGGQVQQFFAIFYLYKFHHYIIHDLHLKYMLSYMDDYVIFSNDLDYLKICKNKIIDFIHSYNLEINEKKTYIVNLKNGFNFLGYNFRIINNKTIINLSENARNNIKKGIKKGIYRYQNNMITFEKYFYSVENYLHSYNFVNKDKINHIIDRYY